MLSNKIRKITVTLFLLAITATAFAAASDLAVRFLDKANEAYEEGNV